MPAATWTLVSCSCNNIALELLTKTAGTSSSSYTLLTFLTYLVVTTQGLLRHPEFLRTRHIPLRSYLPTIVIFFLVNAVHNQILGLNIPFPLVIIFRSGTLVANVILTWLLQNRRYPIGRLFSVFLVTAGIVWFTLSSSHGHKFNVDNQVRDDSDLYTFITAIVLMTATLFASPYLGIMQEKLFMLHGKHPEEMMFYVHFLTLPLFTLVGSEIRVGFLDYWNGPTIWNSSFRFFQMFAVIILQLICIQSVFQLATELTSLQVTMVMTLRKFLNLLFSVLIFKNEFGLQHALSTAMLLVGTMAFYDVHTKGWDWFRERRMRKEK